MAVGQQTCHQMFSDLVFCFLFSQIPPSPIEIATEEEVSAYVLRHIVLTTILYNMSLFSFSLKQFTGV